MHQKTNYPSFFKAFRVDCTSIKQGTDHQCLFEILSKDEFRNSRVVLQFPRDDIQAPPVGEFGDCDSEIVFQDMKRIDKQFDSSRKSVTIHSVKFKLNDLDQYVNSQVTELVTIKADTVYMTNSLTINFNLTILARTISLSNPIYLVYDGNQYSIPKNDKVVQQCYQVNNKVKLRFRKFGYLQLWDEMKSEDELSINCSNDSIALENVNITYWYESTIVNMMYLCCSASLKKEFQSKTIDDVIDFVINLYSDKGKVKDLAHYFNAQRFVRLKMKREITKFHQRPEVSHLIFKDFHIDFHNASKKYIEMVSNQANTIDGIKKDIFEINSKAVELEDRMLNQLGNDQLFMFHLMQSMNMSWIGSMVKR